MKKYVLREALVPNGDLLQQLLAYRGVTENGAREVFLNPSYEEHLHDPFLLKGMKEAVARIKLAIKNDEHIVIYSDYDADGIPTAVVMHDFFKMIGYKNFQVYIPHRHKEGFGLHVLAIDSLLATGAEPKVLITLDCGITDAEEVVHARSKGIDVIITDHHMPPAELPPAFAVIDPKQPGCEYPFKELCGAGVAFKLVQGLLAGGDFHTAPGAEKWLLDMVGLATLSDMVPLVGENRVLARYGLMVLRKSRRPGLRALLRILKIDQRYITEDDIGFMITPRLNAASRMGEPIDAFTLLSTSDVAQADMLAAKLNASNDERKGLVGSLVKEINKIMSERAEHFAARRVIVLGNPLWRPAILGLAAGNLAEEYGKPVFLWGREDGPTIKGSCRSGGVANLVAIMQAAHDVFGDVFLDFGGHHVSGGFSLNADTVHHLEDRLEEALAKVVAAEPVVEGGVDRDIVLLDSTLTLADIQSKTYAAIEKLSPFGVANTKPLFIFKNVGIKTVRQFGKTKNHLELMLVGENSGPVKAISFFATPDDFARRPEEGGSADIVANIEKSFFGYRPELRLRIVDIV